MATKRGRPPARLAGALGDLAEAVGGTDALAALVGVDSRTIRRWADRTREPGGPAKELLARLAKQRGLARPFE